MRSFEIQERRSSALPSFIIPVSFAFSLMAQHFFELLKEFLARYGYWAIAATLLLENAGVPVPGETILVLASFLAYSEHRLNLPYIVLVATCAATLGDNLGYWAGHKGGRPLLDRYQHYLHVPPRTLQRGERIFARYGAPTIFFARFVAGLRIFAGPLAGVLRMDWKKFAVFNLLGACVWVTVISLAGYIFGRQWPHLIHVLKRLDVVIAILAGIVVLFLWRKRRTDQGESGG
jgi:membrane protein DedA with SNARE-associated domain